MGKRMRKGRAARAEAAAHASGVAAAAAAPPAQSSSGLPRDSERIEDFSDAVFGFAATLLVVTLEVPRTYPQLERSLWGFIPFALSFLALTLLWTTHRAFFRRYQLADRTTIGLNSILLFVVLFYIYPLKFMTVSLIEEVVAPLISRVFAERAFPAARASTMFTSESDVAGMFIVYGMGFAAVFACYAMLYAHAARLAEPLRLEAARRHEAGMLCRHYWILAGVGVLSTLAAALDVGVRWGVPGFMYVLIGPLTWIHGVWSERRQASALAAA